MDKLTQEERDSLRAWCLGHQDGGQDVDAEELVWLCGDVLRLLAQTEGDEDDV